MAYGQLQRALQLGRQLSPHLGRCPHRHRSYCLPTEVRAQPPVASRRALSSSHPFGFAPSREDSARRLGVAATASDAELKRAFLQQAKLCHPDTHRLRNSNNPAAMKKAKADFVELVKAYEHLKVGASTETEPTTIITTNATTNNNTKTTQGDARPAGGGQRREGRAVRRLHRLPRRRRAQCGGYQLGGGVALRQARFAAARRRVCWLDGPALGARQVEQGHGARDERRPGH